MHVDLNIEGIDSEDGIKVPYIVTLDEGSVQVLSIYRNIMKKIPRRKRNNILFIISSYLALAFMVLVLSTCSGVYPEQQRQLLDNVIDAGTLSNLPAGFKARGLRIKDDDIPSTRRIQGCRCPFW